MTSRELCNAHRRILQLVRRIDKLQSGAYLAHVKEGIGAHVGEALKEDSLRERLANERRKAGHQLYGNAKH